MSTGFWNPCLHPEDAWIENPERPAQHLCGKCGSVLQGLDEQLLRDTFQRLAQQSGYPMPELGVDMDAA